MYNSPGFIDDLGNELLVKWNDIIKFNYDEQKLSGNGSKFFKLDPNDIQKSISAPIVWFADPAEPNFCRGREVAQQAIGLGQ